MPLKKYLFKITSCILIACVVFSFILTTIYAIFPMKYKNEVISISKDTSVEKNLIFAIIKAESSFKSDKISPKGAVGLMQIMPSTAEFISKTHFSDIIYDLKKPKDNILFGVTYLRYLIEKFENIKTALAAYNAGEGRVLKWLDDKNYSKDGKTLFNIPFKETKTYIKRVLKYYKIYNFLYEN